MRKALLFVTAAFGFSIFANAQDLPAPPLPDANPPVPDGVSGVEGDVGAAMLAKNKGLNAADASEQIALERQIMDVIDTVASAFPEQFSGYEIQNGKPFVFNLYFSRDVDQAALQQLLPAELRRYVKARKVRFNRAERQKLVDESAAALRDKGFQFTARYDLTEDGIAVDVDDTATEASVLAALPEQARANGVVKKGLRKKTLAYTRPTGVSSQDQIYGGWPLYGVASDGSQNMCTAGLSGTDSYGDPILFTAGHCITDLTKSPVKTYNQRTPSYDRSKWINLPTAVNKPYNGANKKLDYASLNVYGFATQGGLMFFRNNVDPYDWEYYYIQRRTGRFIDNSPNIVANMGPEGYLAITGPLRSYSVGVGTKLCKMGIFTGTTCGEVINDYASSDRATGFIEVAKTAQMYIASNGDSGGPVFTPPDANGQTRIAGILSYGYSTNYSDPVRECVKPYNCVFGFMPVERLDDGDPAQIYIYPNNKTLP